MQKIFSADLVFNGETYLPHHAVIADEGKVSAVLPIVSLPDDSEISSHTYLLAPSFIDLQVYGADGKLFSVYPTVETLELMAENFRLSGTTRFLPTVATNTKEVVYQAISAVKEFRKKNAEAIPGIHLEGPWINKTKRGAHIETLIHPPTLQEVKDLIEYAAGSIAMITLAPEICDEAIADLLQSEGILVSAGHSNATYTEATQAFDGGIHLATHLFNAMSPINHRQPGLPVAVMMHESVMCGIIPDGHHVDFEMVKFAKKMMQHRLFLITDAVTATPDGPYPHVLDGDKYVANGILSGSSLTMLQGVKNCLKHIKIDLPEALRMASLYPAKVLGLENICGRIAVGYNADFVFLDKELNVIKGGFDDALGRS